MFNLVLRSTSSFFYNNQFIPVLSSSHDIDTKHPEDYSILGTKKCFVLSVRGKYSWISQKDIDTRLDVHSRLSLNLFYFECNDFTKTPRNCQNVTCMIQDSSDSTYKLACILYLPPCASFIYYLEWKGKTLRGLPDFVTFTDDTDPNIIMQAFHFRQLPLSKNIDIIFVQQVLGPSTNLTYLCSYNHFDKCLELLPNGPTSILPVSIWRSSTISKMIAMSRTHNKLLSNSPTTSVEGHREVQYKNLPHHSDIFETLKRKPNECTYYRFPNGKKIRNDLPLLHISVGTTTEDRLSQRLGSFFAIPLLGSKLGSFANVDYNSIVNIHQVLHNGISVHSHNRILEEIASEIVEYHLCDNETSPVMVTMQSNPQSEYSYHQCQRTYGEVLSQCISTSQVILCFMFYSQYCNPILLTDKHKSYLRDAVGNGSGSRHCCSVPPSVTNLYFGSRSYPTLAQSSPVIGPKMTSHHDNYRKHWNPTMLASFVPICNTLTTAIHHISRWVNPFLEHACCNGSSVIGKSYDNWQLCRTTIITFGKSDKYLGFLNTAHIDKKDLYKKSIQKDLSGYVKTVTDIAIQKYLFSNLKIGIGKPTTCTYQFLNYREVFPECILFQFFLYDGLKLAIRIRDFACKTFYGHMATHRTAMPVIVRNNKVYYTDKHIGVFAWGKS